MHLHDHVTVVQAQLQAAAALGDERTQQTAAALTAVVEPALRLAVLGALSAAANEITAALLDVPGSPTVGVRLDDDEVHIEVRAEAPPVVEDAEPPVADDGEATARISLRLSDGLKADIETVARRQSVSVNTWLVRAAGSALAADRSGPGPRLRVANPRRITGWINS